MVEVKDCWLKDTCLRYGNCESFCMKLFKLDQLYEKALVSLNLRKHVNLRPDGNGTDREEFKQLKSFTDNIEEFVNSGKCLYIHSNTTGNGKTSWALRFIEAYLNAIWWKSDLKCRALYISVPRFILALKENISTPSSYVEYIKSNVFEADLVVLDEVGIKTATTFEMEHLLNIVNQRVELGKSTIYTSNLADSELKEKLGSRLYSRIVNYSYNIELCGIDKRGLFDR